MAWDASGSLRTYADDGRTWEVGQTCTTDEVLEQSRAAGGGEDGGKRFDRGNPPQQNASRTPSRSHAPSALERIRQAAKEDKEVRFTALFHHIYALETLRVAYLSLKKKLHLVWTVRRGGTTEKILRITSMISPIG